MISNVLKLENTFPKTRREYLSRISECLKLSSQTASGGDQHDKTTSAHMHALHSASDPPLQEVHTLAIQTQLGIRDNSAKALH